VLGVLASLLLSAPALADKSILSNEMETGFFESLDLGPDSLVKKSAGEKKSGRKKEKSSKKQESSAQVAKAKTESNQFSKYLSSTNQKSMGKTMLEYIILVVAGVVFTIIILVLLRIYRNTRVVESPDNIVLQIKALSSDIDTQNRQIEEIMQRIQKTENSFIKVLGHHIDERYNQMSKDVDLHFQDFSGNNKTLINQFGEINTKVSGLEGMLGSLQDFVAEQKSQIRRMHEGYDWSTINNVLTNLVSLVDQIDDKLVKLNGDKDGQDLRQIRKNLVEVLDSYDVKEQSPQVGSKFKEDENTQVIMVEGEDTKEKGKVARVIKSGFVYTAGKDGGKVLRSAEIEVYS
jgi:molecular chaperone GrpE (heat shock protein)